MNHVLHDETTKPSRLRRRKKKWRVQSLTMTSAANNIDLHSQKTSVGRENPNDTGQKAANIIAVFLCLPESAGKIRTSFLWRAESGSVRRWPVPVSGFLTLFQSVAHSVRRRSGGLSSNTGVTAMAYAQNAPKFQGQTTPKPQASFDLFKVVNGVKTLICRDLSSNQAMALMPELSADSLYRLKFTGMMEG